ATTTPTAEAKVPDGKGTPVSNVQVGKGSEPQLSALQPNLPPTQREAAAEVKEEKLLPFENTVFRGKLSLTGAQLVDVQFFKYLDQLPPAGKPIKFLQRGGAKGAELFFGETGFLANTDMTMPGRKTVWSTKNQEGVQGAGAMDLFWDNGSGLHFEKNFIMNTDSYMMVVKDRIINQGQKPVVVHGFAQYVRTEPTLDPGQAAAPSDFQGPMGYLDKERIQHTYEVLRKQDQQKTANAGWIGFSDKYFLAALVPGATDTQKKYYFDYDAPVYRVGSVSKPYTVEPGQAVTLETWMYVGPKEIRSLEKQGMGLERAIDYGWLHFLAVPLVDILLFFNDFFHNYGIAIIFLTILVKLLFFPLADKSYRSMNEMKRLQPKMEELRKLYGNDKTRLNQEMMQLYQANKVNPLGGCLPILVQIPVFFALYQVLYLSVEMRHAPFFWWIHDLSIHDPFYVLPLLMGATMFIQTKMNPTPADPIQAKVMLFLPLVFTFMFLTFPAGLVLYWLINNVLSIIQQGYIMKKAG
ncbi:membrane protein insertase YidC, partial [Candidatus Magnetaquicoccus inordinatus]|uniref:membrane protein insertase YidC n=1 Tax=Candidatus Magnetaquicoccus inordinatus TaxID=2496818 RepID=UPI00102C384E